MVSFGKGISKFRNKIGLSQRDLGRKVGVSGQAIDSYEHDLRIPNSKTLAHIADVLGVTMDDLRNQHVQNVA
jgi:transcriptional regulator with XRE-family HTH domain